MKRTRYFDNYIDAYNYYGGTTVPSSEIALVGNASYVFVSSDNSYDGGNTEYYDAGTTNDAIVDSMVQNSYEVGYENGYSYGYPLGYESGYTYGYPLGYTAGTTYGEEVGYISGHAAGYEEGTSYGYDWGYPLGYTAGTTYGEATCIETMIQNGTANITTTSQVDVMNYAYAQVSDANLVSGNILQGVSILGVEGSLEQGIVPSGTAYINANTLADVTTYAYAYCEAQGGGGSGEWVPISQATGSISDLYDGTAESLDVYWGVIQDNFSKEEIFDGNDDLIGYRFEWDDIPIYGQDPYPSEYFTTESLADNNNINFTKGSVASGITMYWSKDKTNWNAVTGSTVSVPANANEKVYWKATLSSGERWGSGDDNFSSFLADDDYKVSGNIMSIVYGDNFAGQTSLSSFGEGVLRNLFTTGSTANDNNPYLVDSSNLVLPCTSSMPTDAYNRMFWGCTNMTGCPKELPYAGTLSEGNYWGMFARTAITESPVIRATGTSDGSMVNMFINCSSLEKITCLLLSTSGSDPVTFWTSGVPSGGTLYKDSQASASLFPVNDSAYGVPAGWTIEDFDNAAWEAEQSSLLTKTTHVIHEAYLDEDDVWPEDEEVGRYADDWFDFMFDDNGDVIEDLYTFITPVMRNVTMTEAPQGSDYDLVLSFEKLVSENDKCNCIDPIEEITESGIYPLNGAAAYNVNIPFNVYKWAADKAEAAGADPDLIQFHMCTGGEVNQSSSAVTDEIEAGMTQATITAGEGVSNRVWVVAWNDEGVSETQPTLYAGDGAWNMAMQGVMAHVVSDPSDSTAFCNVAAILIMINDEYADVYFALPLSNSYGNYLTLDAAYDVAAGNYPDANQISEEVTFGSWNSGDPYSFSISVEDISL